MFKTTYLEAPSILHNGLAYVIIYPDFTVSMPGPHKNGWVSSQVLCTGPRQQTNTKWPREGLVTTQVTTGSGHGCLLVERKPTVLVSAEVSSPWKSTRIAPLSNRTAVHLTEGTTRQKYRNQKVTAKNKN